MTAVIDYNDVMDLATGTISLADHLGNNQPSTGDVWTVTYMDSDGGNEQARFIKFNFTYDNPGDPSISVTGDEFSPNIIFGTSGTDVLTGGNVDDKMFGREGDDQINGLDGNDILVGGGGDDIIVGGAGNDEIHGGEGADAYVISSLSDGVDTIVNYDDSESDVLDISDILTGYDINNDDIADFVSITTDGADAIVSVDPTGSGTYTDIAVLSNISGNTVTVIVDQDNNLETLIVA
jgi:Ca2+-binding RTX toxin-like protein